jgi:hypothetical protein
MMKMFNVAPTATISLLMGKSKYFTRKGGAVKLRTKGTVNSDHLNQAEYVIFGAAVQFASSFYLPLSIVS